MTKMLQVRNVPDDIHARLRHRASAAGMSLSEFVLRELQSVAHRRSVDEVLDEAATGASAEFTFDEINHLVRADRESR